MPKGQLYASEMAFKDRFREAIKGAGVSQAKVAAETGVTPQAVSGWARGEAIPEIDKLPVIAAMTGRTIDWLLDHEPDLRSEDVSHTLDGPQAPMVKVKGYVGAGGSANFYNLGDGDLDEIRASDRDPPGAAAVEIKGTSLGRFFDRWYAIYRDVRAPITDDLVGVLCVVGLDDDSVFIKKVMRAAKGRFDLISNSDDEPPIRNVRIKWAAKVTDIRSK